MRIRIFFYYTYIFSKYNIHVQKHMFVNLFIYSIYFISYIYNQCWGNYLKLFEWRDLFEKLTDISFCKLKSNALLYYLLEKAIGLRNLWCITPTPYIILIYLYFYFNTIEKQFICIKLFIYVCHWHPPPPPRHFGLCIPASAKLFLKYFINIFIFKNSPRSRSEFPFWIKWFAIRNWLERFETVNYFATQWFNWFGVSKFLLILCSLLAFSSYIIYSLLE